MHSAPIIAIDGPAGSGKSTAAKNLARALGFTYIDTGAMYRAVTWKAIKNGIDLDNEPALVDLTRDISLRLEPENSATRVFVDGTEVTDAIRNEAVSRQVYHVAAEPRCRELIVRKQREMGKNGGVVAEGRDIGTVVFPDAELKIFLSAEPGERARRRCEQLAEAGMHPDYNDVLREIELRDKRDAEREASPLRKAPDAVAVDNTGCTAEETIEKLLDVVRRSLPGLNVRR